MIKTRYQMGLLRLPRGSYPALLSLFFGWAGCATYGSGIQPVIDRLRAGDPQGALNQLELKPRRDDALFQLEDAMLLRLAGCYAQSNRAFDAADRITEDLYTRSISRQAASLAISDRLAPYRPPPFERILARVYHVLNYLDMGEFSEAIIEARRIEQLLDELDDAGVRASQSPGGRLAMLTAALAFEASAQFDDAFRMYRRFTESVSKEEGSDAIVPSWVESRMWTLAHRTSFDLTGIPGLDRRATTDSLACTVVLFLDHGLVPQRQEMRFDLPILRTEVREEPDVIAPRLCNRALLHGEETWRYADSEIAYWVAIALPFYPASPAVPTVTVEVEGKTVDAQPLVNIAELARGALAEEMPGIVLRTVVRGLMKYGAHREAKKHVGAVGGILTNAFGVATEQAETRSWSTLPQDISLAVISLPFPVERVCLHWRDGDGHESAEFLPLSAGGKGRFLFSTGRLWR